MRTIGFRDMFYFDNNQYRAQPTQRVEWLVYRIRELKTRLRRYVMLTNMGYNFHEVLEDIATALNNWYLDIYVILIDIGRVDLWTTLDLGWPVTDLICS